ncbi:hypothetical protein [Actinosynnema sp. NPDC023587]|uniref:hypothetical protein n=1 Tax=Actinosynnema sp. NPDC023587 TaxID=3154695 RepID=UPI0033FD6883
MAQAVGNRHDMARFLLGLGVIYRRWRRFPESVECLERCLAVLSGLADLHGEAEARTELGLTWLEAGNSGRARADLSAAWEILVRLPGAGPAASATRVRGWWPAS